MKYVYDILLNFNENYYDFYDWNKEDKIIHIKKIPIYKIKENDLKNIIYGMVVLENKFLDMIKDKTEIFTKHEVKKIKYCCLLCTDEKIVAINLNTNGKIIGKSDLLIDEYSEIVDSLCECEYIDLNYVLEEKFKVNDFTTRSVKEKSKFIEKELNKFNNEELEYIYYECFLEQEKCKSTILKRLTALVYQDNLYNLVNMLSRKYKKIK